MKRIGPRKKYNYEFIIHDWELEDDFEEYCFNHEKVRSKTRLARSFLLNLGINFRLPCYELGNECAFLNWVSDQVQKGQIIVED